MTDFLQRRVNRVVVPGVISPAKAAGVFLKTRLIL
jgi:hypothetical protein